MGTKGKHWSSEIKQKISNKLMGHAPWSKGCTPWNKGRVGVYSEETLKKISLAGIGRKHTEEAKKKISIGNKGKILSAETKEKLRKINLGKKISDETRKKLRESHLGYVLSKEHKKKISVALLGRKGFKHTEQSKKNMSKAQKGKKHPHSEKTKKKISLGNKGRIVSLETREKLSRARLGKKMPQMCGENHWNWHGGSSFAPYAIDWTSTLRRSIRERDQYTCKICGAKQEDRVFAVHHIDYDKKNCNSDNLVTLCYSCHSKTNSNREYWINYFNINLKL